MAKKFVILGLSMLLLAGCGQMEASVEKVQDSIKSIQIFTDKKPSGVETEPSEREVVPQISTNRESVTDQAQPLILHTFDFERISRDELDSDGVRLLTESRCVTSFHSSDPELSEWVGGILRDGRQQFDINSRKLLEYAREVIRDSGTETFYTYSNYEEQAVNRHDSRFASLVTISHVHAGGAHPNTVQTAQNLDLQQRRILRLEDVILEDQAPVLAEMVQTAVCEKFELLGLNALYEEAPDTVRRSLHYGEMTPYWYFSPDALVIFYNQYELGPYAAGIIKAELPYESLRGILKGEFFPQPFQQTDGRLTVAAALNGREPILLKLGSENEQILLETKARIREIQISEVSWVDETPVNQTMMLSVSEMDEHQVLVVTGGFSDENRSFAVEYIDGAGNRHLEYLHRDGLSELPQQITEKTE